MSPPSLPPHSELTLLLDTHSNTKFAKNHKMCPLKNLLSKRSTRNLRSIKNLRDPALSPYPPNNFPFKPLYNDGETNPDDAICEALEEAFGFGSSTEPKGKPKREPKFGSKRTKRDTERVLQTPLLLPPFPFPFPFFLSIQLTLIPPSARTLLPHLPRSLQSARAPRR